VTLPNKTLAKDALSMRLVGEYRTYNILQVGDRYCAVPQALGAVTGEDHHILTGRHALWADRRQEVEGVIDKLGSFGENGSFSTAMRLVGEYRTYNLLQVGGRYCAVPQALGPFTVDDDHILAGRYVLWADRSEDLLGLVDREGAFGDFDSLYSPTPLTMRGLPEVVEMELIHSCNLRCTMCHVSYEELTKTRLDPSFVRRLGGLEGKWAKLGAMYEPVAHPHFSQIARALTELGMKIDLTSNGTLFTQKLISKITDCNFRVVTLSFDGARRETYEKIRRGADYGQAMERILAFKEAVQKVNPNVLFQINYTVMQNNIDEIVEAVDLWESHGFDHLGFISMVLPVPTGEIVNESPMPVLAKLQKQMLAAAVRVIERKYRITLSSPWFLHDDLRAVYPRNIGLEGAGLVVSDHPGRRLPTSPSAYFQNGSFPGMQVDCRSPFKFVRINYDGAVRLCQKFTVGSIYENDLLAIWNGPVSEALRVEVQGDIDICRSCEYFKFCIRAGQVNYDDPTVFASQNRFEIIETKMLRYIIVRYNSKLYACPHPMRISEEDLLRRERRVQLGIEVADNVEEARRAGRGCLWRLARKKMKALFLMRDGVR
jgi:radical SAM protein with 4Fe4S-binding SPASM domain